MSSKGKRKRKHGPGRAVSGSGAKQRSASVGSQLLELAERLAATTQPADIGPLWGVVHKTLLASDLDAKQAASIVVSRDLTALRACAEAMVHERNPNDAIAADEQPAPVASDIPEETLRKAMHAFRKRLKLTRLDHESKLGVGPMTSGRTADVDAIMPPREFADEVWHTLVAQGKLKAAGRGFYALGSEK